MSRPVLLAVAHGSRDPAAREAVLALTGRAARLAPGVDVRTAFVERAEPSLARALADAARDVGPGGLAVVPLLLSTGYHVHSDIAATATPAGVAVAAPLGPDPRLVPALADRLATAGAPGGAPAVLAAAGSRDPGAAADTRRQAALLAEHLRAPVLAAYLSAGGPTVDEAVAALAAHTGGPVAVATYLLAPGSFHDQLRRSTAAWVSAPLGDHPAVAELILGRFQATRVAARSGAG
jgi:sirohydrochlorin ferrochelatase